MRPCRLCRTIFLLACACFIGAEASADPLSDLLNSPQMQKFQQGGGDDNLYGPRYLKEGSNFASVFIAGDGYANLQTWISPNEAGFLGGPIIGSKTAEYAEAVRNFTSDTANEIRVRVLVPHPKFVPMLKYNLIKAFSELQPPELEFVNKETIEIRGEKAQLYTHRDQSCSLLMTVTRSTIIQLFQAECSGLHHLVTLAEALDIKRLERKLES